MCSVKVSDHWGNLKIGSYNNQSYDPLMPILQQEFPNWNSKRIKSYMNLVSQGDSEISGILAAKNESGYYVGFVIYAFHQIDKGKFNSLEFSEQNETYNVFVIENINSCIPILQKQIFLAMVDECIKIANANNCDYIELPTLNTQSYDLVKNKYNNQIQDSKSFRTYIKI
jgi:hypothetical protein